MAKQDLHIDYDYYQRSQCSFEDLKDASQKLTAGTQEQFEQIKREKWFTRVFDMVTFSKKNEKRMAGQIGNLAQAQQMLMEILVRLSARDESISKLVVECFDKLERLSENDLDLARKVKQLEYSCILGVNKQTDLLDLTEMERNILGGVFFDLLNKFEEVSEEQRRYVNGVLNYLAIEGQPIDIKKSLDSIKNIDAKKKILICCLEYGFLNDCNFEYIDDFEDLIEEFDFGNKTIREIKNRIETTYKLRGADGFIDKYSGYNFDFEEEFAVEWEDLEEEIEDVEMTDLYITSIIHIAEGETKHFKNNYVHISAYINCNGQLIFENCIIYYNESESVDEITLSEGASIKFLNSKIVCMGAEETAFIQGQFENEIVLQNCELVNCSYFIHTSSKSNVILDNCRIENPSKDLLSGSFENGTISNCYIRFTKIPEQNIKLVEKTGFLTADSIFSNSSYDDEVDNSIKFEECVIEGDSDFNKEDHNIRIFNIYRAFYENCTFRNINNCIVGAEKISSCIFINGKNVMELDPVFDHPKNISNCLFEQCENAIKAISCKITNCQFVECRNRVIETGYSGDVSIEFCEFYNLIYEKENESWDDDGCFYFTRMQGKENYSSRLKKCLFNGVKINNEFLIIGKIIGKVTNPAVYIEECQFQNCETNKTSGDIIKEYDHYFGLFDKKVDVKTVTITNCKGLDKINKEGNCTKDITIKDQILTSLKMASTRDDSAGIHEFCEKEAASTVEEAVHSKVVNLIKGQRVPLSNQSRYVAKMSRDLSDLNELDFSALILQQNGKVSGDNDFIFYNQPAHPSGAVYFSGHGSEQMVTVDLDKVPDSLEKVVFTLTIGQSEMHQAEFSPLGFLNLQIFENDHELYCFNVTEPFTNETGIILGEMYRYKNGWKFGTVGNGFHNGLKGLCDLFGVDLE